MRRVEKQAASRLADQRKPWLARTVLELHGIFILMVMVFGATPMAVVARQPAPGQARARQSSKAPSPFAEAEELFRQGSDEEAKQKIAEQLRQNPKSAEGYNLLGIIYTSEKNYAQALDAFQQALNIEPKSAITRNNIGNVYVAQQNLVLAEQEFRKALQLDPSNNDGNYNVGLVLLAKGAPAQAISYFQRVHPSNISTRLNLIRAYLQSGRTTEGLKIVAEISSQNKDDVQLRFTLGMLLSSEKQYKAAQLELEKANALQPDTFEILYNLGQSLSSQRRVRQGRASFESRAQAQAGFRRNVVSDGAG